MSCLRRKLAKLNKVVEEAERLAQENKCNFVVVSIRHVWMYDKESCWIRDGRVGTLVRLIKYDKL